MSGHDALLLLEADGRQPSRAGALDGGGWQAAGPTTGFLR